ncbi:MAG: glycosyltransferase family 4 protein [Lachnospiraceae bacterium]|nr:glycosyltransferase family 4 protein [Lachnospiraceae bacterium]
MQIVFVSNYINHHQLPFCKAMLAQNEGEFFFIQTEPMEQERTAMGWALDVKEYPFVRCYYEEPESCQKLIDEGEIVIFGGVEEESYIEPRLESGKLTIRCSERIYKEGQWKFISPRGLKKKYHDHIRYRKKNVYLLCAGGYVASDFQLIRAYPGKMFVWGYFPEFIEYRADELMDHKNADGSTEILWAGRMIDWKHPEHAIEAVKDVLKEDPKIHLTMAGGGEMEPQLKQMAAELGVEGSITFTGYLNPKEIREKMLAADIFLFTSDYKEGWGAVLNEAMNSGCAVIASSGIGAVPYLLRHGKNSMVYRNGKKKELKQYVRELVEQKGMCRSLGLAAYETIRNTWNADVAATNLLRLLRSIRMEQPEAAVSGPASCADIIAPRKGYMYTRR